jgi:hypothetical protein
MEKNNDIEALSKFITDEIFKLFKVDPHSWVRQTLGPLLRVPAHRFAQVTDTFDHYVEEFGFCEAALRILPVFAQGFEARNIENVPREGPLLITSNHPGTCDSLVIAANIPRRDLKIVAAENPFIAGVRHTAENLIYTTLDAHERMMVVRKVIRHLQGGGAVLIFPSGSIDPDPAISPKAADDLANWSPSIELMLRRVPQTRVLLTIVSGVLSARWRWNLFVRMLGDDHKQRSVAEVMQVIQQMIFPNSVQLTPRLSFANPLTTAELAAMGQGILNEMIDRARCLMEDHMAQGGKLLTPGT